MSFAEHLLDGYEGLEKKTAVSVAGLKGLSGFMKHMGEVMKKCSTEAQGVCSKYRTKENCNQEGSIKAAIIILLDEIESTIVGPFGSLSGEFERSSKDFDAFVKDREQARKKLLSEASRIQKDWEATQSALKKAKEAYFKCAKESDAADAACEKAKAQDKNVPAASQKADAAKDKARAADDSYGSVLVHTNDYQRTYYTETQPELLTRFQQWEEDRFKFVQNQLSTLMDKIVEQELPSKWEHFSTGVKECSQAIDSNNDLEAYACSISSKVSVPNDIPYEKAPVGPSNGGPEKLSSNPSGKPTTRATQSAAPAAVSAAASAAASAQGGDDGEGGEGEKHRALFDYEAVNDGELSLKEGQIVYISEKDPTGWWYAITEDRKAEGFVPSSYVEPI